MTKAVETDFLVLTARPGSDVLNDKKLVELADAIPTLPAADRLGADAVQYAIAPDLTGIADALTDRFGQEPFDVNRVSDSARQKKMLIADLESTIIEQECLDELAKTIGKEDVIADITRRAMRGELDFEPALKERVAMLKGMPESALQELYDSGISLMPGAATLLATLRKHNVFCGLVSGGFAFFVSRIAYKLAFDRFQSNDLILKDKMLDGTIVEPILGRAAKAEILKGWADELGFVEDQVLAVGDGSNDL
ncbi:MAG: phosphoserine phosphatase SerB, partial [Alphaproteobacteria bacterium]|nr:phosphoserine phosphatase SerB [Alphaproteobacteria bacterium]